MDSNDDMVKGTISDTVSRMLDGELSDQEFSALEQRLREDPRARELYFDCISLEVSLEAVFAPPLSRSHGRIRRKVSSASIRKNVQLSLGIAAAAVLVIASVMYVIQAKQTPAGAGLRLCGNSQWSLDGAMNPDSAILAYGSDFLLHQGVAELKLPNEVVALVEAPASMKLLNDRTLYMNHGKALFKVQTKQGHGFTVLTPHQRIVDLGTEFGLVVHTPPPAPVIRTTWRGDRNKDEQAYSTNVSDSDLLTGLRATTSGWNFRNGSSASAINDGIHGESFENAGKLVAGAWTTVGATAEFHLGKGNGKGFDISTIQSIASWRGAGYGNQAWTVEVKRIKESNYAILAKVDYQPLNDKAGGATCVVLKEDSGGALASGIESIRFTANSVNQGENNGAFVLREFDVFGTATPAEETGATTLEGIASDETELQVLVGKVRIEATDGKTQGQILESGRAVILDGLTIARDLGKSRSTFRSILPTKTHTLLTEDFETGLSDGEFSNTNRLPGWISTPGFVTFNPAANGDHYTDFRLKDDSRAKGTIGAMKGPTLGCFTEAPGGARIRHELGQILADSRYTVSTGIGIRVDNPLSQGFDGYTIRLISGDTVLSSLISNQPPGAANGIVPVSFSWDSDMLPPSVKTGHPLAIEIMPNQASGAAAGYLDFDNVSVSVLRNSED